MFDAQKVLWETGRVAALWIARGASDRNMVETREDCNQERTASCTAGMTDVKGWGVGRDVVELFAESSAGKANAASGGSRVAPSIKVVHMQTSQSILCR